MGLGNKAVEIGGRLYTGHALDGMQRVGIIPSVVERHNKLRC
jgi:hypothetical protein